MLTPDKPSLYSGSRLFEFEMKVIELELPTRRIGCYVGKGTALRLSRRNLCATREHIVRRGHKKAIKKPAIGLIRH